MVLMQIPTFGFDSFDACFLFDVASGFEELVCYGLLFCLLA